MKLRVCPLSPFTFVTVIVLIQFISFAISELNHEVHALQTKFEKSNEKVAHLEQVIADNEDMNIKVLNLISQNKRRK